MEMHVLYVILRGNFTWNLPGALPAVGAMLA